VGNVHLIAECKGFEDTRNWVFHDTLENAKASFGSVAAPAATPAASPEAAPAAPAPALANA